MALSLKNHKETPKTVTITLSVDDTEDVKKAKALIMLLGDYNPLRGQMKNDLEALKALDAIKESGEFSFLISELAKHFY